MSYKYSHYIPHVKEGSKHTGIDISRGNSTFFVIAISFPVTSDFVVFNQRNMEKGQSRNGITTVLLCKVFTLLSVPFYLVEMNPVVSTIDFIRLIVIGIHAIEQCLYLVLLLRTINRNHTITTSHNIFRAFCPHIVGRLQEEIIDFIARQVFCIMVSHHHHKRHLGFIENIHYTFPSIHSRVIGHHIPTQYSNVRMFGCQDSTDSSCRFGTLCRTRHPVQICKLCYYKLAILKKELLLRKSRYRHTAQQYN